VVVRDDQRVEEDGPLDRAKCGRARHRNRG
jgi:hypothetical protein